MKKSLLYAILLAGVLFAMMPTQAQAQSGTVWGGSLVGYDSQAREIFGYSATWLDYDAAWYYDPAVGGELYWQFDNEVPLDRGSDTGYSDPYWGYLLDAQVWLFSSQYRPVTTYATYSNHFVVPYYYDSYYGYYDPFGFSFFGGGDFGGYYGLPGYGYYPGYYIPSDYEYLFSTGVSIQTPSDACRIPGMQFDEVGRSCNNPPIVTPTPSDSLSVTLSDIKAVPKNGEVTVNVNITPANNSTAVTLTLATDANTTGSATFDDGTTTRQVTQTTTVKIKGVTESSTRDNISLTATAMDTNRAKVKFSVLWVTLTLRYGNNLEVSADNAARQNYIQRMGGISHLGTFQDKSSIPMWGPAVEIVGQVTPSNFEGEVKLNRQIIAGRLYRGRTLREREDDAPDNSPFLFDHDPQSGGSNGKVYDIDKPSIGMQHEPGFPVGYIIRKRENFKEWAEFNGMKVSDDLLWFARVSIIKNTEGKDVLEANSVTHCRTDHIAGVGETPLTWNLCPEQPPAPFGFNPIDDAGTFVDAHYWDFFDHAPDQGGLDFWTGEITQCGSDAACVDRKRVDVARAFFYSGEFIGMHPELNAPRGTHEYNAAFVRLCYLTYLRREPNAAPDNNFDGFNFWVNHLDSTNPDAGDGKYNGMIHAFLLSAEYRGRFSQ